MKPLTKVIEDLISTIEENAVNNVATISNVKLWAESWRKEADLCTEPAKSDKSAVEILTEKWGAPQMASTNAADVFMKIKALEAMEEYANLRNTPQSLNKEAVNLREELIRFIEWMDEFSFMTSIHDTREEVADKYLSTHEPTKQPSDEEIEAWVKNADKPQDDPRNYYERGKIYGAKAMRDGKIRGEYAT